MITYAKKVSGGDQARERRYLQIYFFEEHTGRGLPEEKCMSAALQIASADMTQPLPTLMPLSSAMTLGTTEARAELGE